MGRLLYLLIEVMKKDKVAAGILFLISFMIFFAIMTLISAGIHGNLVLISPHR